MAMFRRFCRTLVPLVVLAAACAGIGKCSGPARPTDNMVDIPGGSFAMGSEDSDASPSEKPVHEVTVAALRLDKNEVTVAEYGACVAAGKCSPPESYANERGNFRSSCNWRHPEQRLAHPINCVDFTQAAAYCAWLGKRLPTEEEWEYAARGGALGRKYPWGDSVPDATRLNACGTECPANLVAKHFPAPAPMYASGDGWSETAPVGSFPAGASKDGVLDMAGNVWEWTATLYASYDGKSREPKRVLRGGSWGGGDPRTERATNRFRLAPESRAQFLGFRCASKASGG